MKRKSISFPYLALAIFLFCWINLPKTVSDQARYFAIASIGPWVDRSHPNSQPSEIARLRMENQNLRAQMDHVYDWMLFDQEIYSQIDLFKSLAKEQMLTLEGPNRAFLHRRAAHLGLLLQNQLFSVPSRVIYRDPSSWSSSLWVNVGEEDNRNLGQAIVAKNSPVLSGGAIVGVVDHVGKKQSRVRLITDSGLSPAVRAVRGAIHNRELNMQIQTLLQQLEKRNDLFATEAEKKELFNKLNQLKEKNGTHWDDSYLAKGEIHGSSVPFWRSRGTLLKGIGFNLDYPDEEGLARDLKGEILKEGDLLVTSGLDGVFPPGIKVGTVSKVAPLKQGSYSYNIEVRPCATNLNDLETVFILPAISE